MWTHVILYVNRPINSISKSDAVFISHTPYDSPFACCVQSRGAKYYQLKSFYLKGEKKNKEIINTSVNSFVFFIIFRRTVRQFPGHHGAVRGLTVSTDGRVLVSCGSDSR